MDEKYSIKFAQFIISYGCSTDLFYDKPQLVSNCILDFHVTFSLLKILQVINSESNKDVTLYL